MKFFKSWRRQGSEDDAEAVYVSEKSGVRSLHIGSDTIQSAMRIAHPYDLELAYTRSMMAGLLFNPAPRAVLMIGLGGGSLAKFVYHRLPRARTIVVEVKPRVVAIAREFFRVPPDDERLRVVVGDGAAYLAGGKRRADMLMVDGYDAQAQSPALCTLQFYRNCAAALGSAGILVINLWGGSSDFGRCVERIRKAFGGHIACLPAGRPGNVVVLAFRRSPGYPRWSELRARARTLEAALGLEFPRFVEGLAALNPHDEEQLLV